MRHRSAPCPTRAPACPAPVATLQPARQRRRLPAWLLPFFLLLGSGLPGHGAWAQADDAAAPLAAPALNEAPPEACSQGRHLPPPGQAGDGELAAMQGLLHQYLQLSEQALSMRAQAIRLYRALDAKVARGEALSGADLQRLNEGAAALLSQRDELLRLAVTHECWTRSAPAENGNAARIQRTGVLISLSAALTLYDNYLSAISLYQSDPRLRQHLNRPDPGFALQRNTLNKVAQMYASPDNRRRVRRAIDWYERHGRSGEGLAGYDYLLEAVAQSPSFHTIRQQTLLGELGAQLKLFNSATLDAVFGLRSEATHLSSLLFGNTVGLVEARRGKLYRQPAVTDRVSGRLQAGDILLEKTPFRLTDTFIPGHWGHAAIWIGNEAELKALGLWEHPLVRPHHGAVRDGRSVVEALRSGVEMNRVADFLNVDDLAILRQDTLPAEKRREVILQALRQVGKSYDFNFDVETTHRVFCSKLVYLAYGDLRWPTTRFLGRTTISPDNIAQQAIDSGPLQVALLFHDGHEVNAEPRQFLARLLAGQAAREAREAGGGTGHEPTPEAAQTRDGALPLVAP